MRTLKTKFLTQSLNYDGSQLRNHYIYEQTEILGDALIAFIGGADVSIDAMVDAEDVLKKAPIYSTKMVHFIGEFFIDQFESAVLYQHFLMQLIYEEMKEKHTAFSRKTNDLFFEGRKFSVSIATKTQVSVLIHAGVNVDTHGTPIPTSGLSELGEDAQEFAQRTLERFRTEFSAWQKARCKVYPK